MENQSTNNTNIIPGENKVLCRKCGGSHFTIKCGKQKQSEHTYETKTEKVSDKPNNLNKYKGEQKLWSDDKNGKPYERRSYFKTTYRVKLSDLPIDMSEEEMMELTCDWGNIVKIRVINYPEASVAYIDFSNEDEADYFVKALDKTQFEFLIIFAQRVESHRT